MNPQNVQALWPHIHSLTVLAAAGSFTAAAQRLGISKAAMSQRIADLEKAAGVPLVRRTTCGSPTRARRSSTARATHSSRSASISRA